MEKRYGYASHLPIGRAIRKYGWDNFEHNILYENLDENEAKRIEIDLISKYKTQDSDYGYNIAAGGNGVCGWHPSKESRRKMSESAKKLNRYGENNPNYNNKWTDDMKKKVSNMHKRENLSQTTLNKMSNAAKDRYGNKNPFYGKTHSDETKKKLAESRYVPIIQLDLDNNYISEYKSIKNAAEINSINKVSISNCCRGITKTAGGYKWKYKK